MKNNGNFSRETNLKLLRRPFLNYQKKKKKIQQIIFPYSKFSKHYRALFTPNFFRSKLSDQVLE